LEGILQPPLLKATSLAPAAQRWLQTSTAARVLHVFESACNLVNDKGEILSLVTAATGNGPFALVVVPARGRFSFAAWIGTPSKFTACDHLLRLGPLVVDWRGATPWQPRPRWEVLRRRPSVWQHHLPSLRRLLHEWAVGPGRSAPASLAQRWQAAAEGAAAQLQQGVAAGDLGRCRAGAAALAGLGEGLTPAGDDFLVGVMAALWSCFPATDAAHLAGAMAQAAVPRTTLLSGAWLQAAAHGEAGINWHLLVEALAGNGAPAVRRAGQHILQTGHTSGAAALAGFLAAAGSRACA
jgi:hypothetical protein